EEIRERCGLRGLICTHILSSDDGTAQFMVPSHLQRNMSRLPLPTDEEGQLQASARMPKKWKLLVRDPVRRKLCQRCWQYMDIEIDGVRTHGPAQDCPNSHKCAFCSSEKTCEAKCQNPGVFSCPHPDCAPDSNHSIFRCPLYMRKRVGLGLADSKFTLRRRVTDMSGAAQELKRDAREHGLEASGSAEASDEYPALGRGPTRAQSSRSAWQSTAREAELTAKVADLS